MISKRGRLLAAAGVALVATLGLAPTDSGAQERVRWKMQSAFPGNLSHLGTSARRLEAMVERVSGGNFELKFFEPGALVPALECFDAASKGSVDPASPPRAITPASIRRSPSSPRCRSARLRRVFRLDDLRRRQGSAERDLRQGDLYSIDCNMIGPETSGWFKKQVDRSTASRA